MRRRSTTVSETYNNYMLKRQLGFTIIELLVVTTIIIVLMAIGMVTYTQVNQSARDSKRRNDLETVRQAMTLYRSDNSTFPYGLGWDYDDVADALVDAGYLSNPYPTDPSETAYLPGLNISVYAASAGYTYSYVGSQTSFCICALLENTGNGNSTANANASCSGIGGTGSNNYYCVKNL